MSTAHVLVVDDEADIRALIQEILTDENYQVTVAANATEARTARKENRFDLVLLDIWMPDTDGISLLREWSEHGDLETPVVIMSGHGTVDTAVEATRLGALDFVEKPLSIAKLLRTVERGLESARKQAGSGREHADADDRQRQDADGLHPARSGGHGPTPHASAEAGAGRRRRRSSAAPFFQTRRKRWWRLNHERRDAAGWFQSRSARRVAL